MNRLLWTLRRVETNTDYAVLTIVALVVLGAILYALAIVPRESRLATVEAAVALQSRQLAVLQQPLENQLATNRDASASQGIPPVTSLPDATGRLQALAHSQGATISQANFRLQREGVLYRYQMTTELGSSYKDVRHFVHEAMRQNPTLSLDRLEIEQSETDGAPPRTTVEFSFYFREQDGTKVPVPVELKQ